MELHSRIGKLTLQQRLIAIIFLVSAIASTLGFLATAVRDFRDTRHALADNARVIARTVATYSIPDLVFEDRVAARETMDALTGMDMVQQAFIMDAQGRLFVSLHPGAPQTLPDEAAAVAEFRDELLHIVEPIRHDGRYVGSLHLQMSTAALHAEVLRRLLTLSLLLGLVLIISFTLSVWLQGIVSDPILRLADTARRISENADFSERVTPPSSDEIGALYSAFNVMLDRVQEHDQARAAAFEDLAATHDAMRESERDLGAIIEILPLVVFAKDVRELRYVRFNRAAEALLGISREQVIGKTDHDIFSPEQADAYVARDRETLASGELLDIPEETIETPSGRRRLHTRKVVVRAIDGAPRYLLGISEDISERKAAEAARERTARQLQQAQKMEAMGQLTGGIAHDFNNILASMLGYTGMALKLLAAGKIDQLAEHLDQVSRSGKRGQDLVKTMLSYARGGSNTAGSLTLEPHVRDVMQMLAAAIPAGIALSTRIEESLPAVRGNAVHMQQVLSNMVINARDALHGRGRIDVSVQLTQQAHRLCNTCHEVFSGSFVELAVHDNGPGIRHGDLDRLFTPFFTTKDFGEGTGLGLAVVHGLMHEHGGHVGVESAPGRGSVFRTWWRVSDVGARVAEANPAREHGGAVGPRGHGQHIIVVDDEPSLAKLMADLLDAHGYQVDAFNDPLLARDFIVSVDCGVDLLITDQNMPKLSGLELAQSLRQIRPDLPTLVLSGHSEILSSANYRDLGIGAYLDKPFDLTTLVRAVADILRSRGR
ncbi:MAG: response regulator [Gammaproteobacteria bacterium]|nr:response regulator [Gammaproteobacteria bacterium]